MNQRSLLGAALLVAIGHTQVARAQDDSVDADTSLPQAPAAADPVAEEAAPEPEAALEERAPVAEDDASTTASASVSADAATANGATSAPGAGETTTDFAAARTPITTTFGSGDDAFDLTFYGFLQADYIYDTTRSYHDAIGASIVARTDTHEGTVGRTQFSARNTRLGFSFRPKTPGGIRPSLVLEMDFFGNQTERGALEGAFYDSAGLRMRHAYVSFETDVVDVLVGQSNDLFGWQNYFFPASAEFLGLPNQVFSRRPQIRVGHQFGKTGPVGLEIAAAALRPVQSDSQVPDANAGIRFSLNNWQGLSTPGSGETRAQPLAIGVSAVVRQFDVDAFTPPPTQSSNVVMGWGASVDAFIPVLPADDAFDRGNTLSLTGSFVMGTGIGELMTVTGGATFPNLPNPALATPPPEYHGNVDPGLVSFDQLGVLNTIDWQAFRVGLQYYFPPSGRLMFAANYTQAFSANMRDLFPKGGAEIELLTRVADRSQYADANLFFDLSNALRVGVAGAYTTMKYLDEDQPHNIRGKAQLVYFF